MPYFTQYQCTGCGQLYSPDVPQTYCQPCQSPLIARYDLARASSELVKEGFRQKPRGMWRWAELLPVIHPGNIISLGEGDTSLLTLPRLGNALNLRRLFIKDESTNPTGTFKARGMSSAVSKAKELGLMKLALPSAGNAAGALSAYAAKARMEAYVCMPQDAPITNILESQLAGVQMSLIPGLISDCARLVSESARQDGWFDLSTFKEPWRVEGKKTMGYEIAESFAWQLPEVIIYPTGGGTGLVGMWKAFQEMRELGWLASQQLPRMVSVQASGCAPVVRAFERGADTCEFWTDAETIASGLRVPNPFADRLILKILRESMGIAVAVEDLEIESAKVQLGKLEGIYCAPEGAATLAGLIRLIDSGWVKPGERIVLFNTGSGLKYVS